MPHPSARDCVCAALSAALGGWALYKTQAVSKETMDPILAACTGSDDSDYELVAYEPLFGGPFVCIGTQFVHFLVTNGPAGFIVWMATFAASLPLVILMNVEAGRSGSRGPIRWPTVITFFSILVAVSVSVPLIWIPSFLLLGGPRTGAVLPKRSYASIYLALPMTILSILMFVVNVATYQWTLVAGLMLSPLLAASSLLLWGMEPKAPATLKQVAQGAVATSRAYACMSLFALGFWVAVLRVVYTNYQTDVNALWAAIWKEAHPVVQFMTIDAIVLFLGLAIYIAAIDPVDAVVTLFATPLLGPGAACGIMFWGHERVRLARAMAAIQYLEQQAKQK